MASNPTRRLLMTTDLLTCLTAIPDRRRAEGKIYGQAGVILFSILAMVSGARSYRQIHTLIDRRLGPLNAAFPGTVLHGSGSRAPRPLPRPGSGDADGLRASQLQHAVERVDADVDLGGAAPVGARVQPIPDHAFVA